MANINQESLCDNYLTIEALEDDLTVAFSVNPLQYSIDSCKTWTELPVGTTTPAINTGEKLYFKATGLTPTSSAGIGRFTVNKQFNLSGNCMSMLFGDNGKDSYDLTGFNYAFFKLFYNCTTLKSVSANFLPATTLTTYCYRSMFGNCNSLTTAPVLPATTLEGYCYYAMFYTCKNLTTAPELPATSLAISCYDSMLQNCTSLTIAPELPATTLKNKCYYFMFSGCTGLTIAPELPATTLVTSCYQGMFNGCSKLNYIKAMFVTTPSTSYTTNWVYGVASTGTFVKNIDATWDVRGVNGVPEGWTITTEANE